MIPVPALPSLADETKIFEAVRTLSERGVQDDFQIATTSPLTISGTDPGGGAVTTLVGGAAVLRGGKLTVGLNLPGGTTTYLRGDGTWGTPPGTGGFTQRSILFAGATGFAAEDNPNFNYNSTFKSVGLGTAAAASAMVSIVPLVSTVISSANPTDSTFSQVYLSTGTTTPIIGQLQVTGSAFGGVGGTGPSSTILKASSTGGTGILALVAADAAGHVDFYSGGTAAANLRMSIFSGGGVSVGTGTSLGTDGGLTPRLGVSNPSNGQQYVLFGYDNTGQYGFIEAVHVGTAWKNLVLNPVGSQYVGVHQTNPGQALDVGSATTDLVRSYGGFTGNATANIGGTGAAAYFPNGVYVSGSSPNSWIYGGVNFNGSISAAGATTINTAGFTLNGDLISGSGTSFGCFSVLVTRTTINRHAFEDTSALNTVDTGLGYAGFDAHATLTNPNAQDHFIGFQARHVYNGSANLTSRYVGLDVTMAISGAGTIANAYGVRVMDITHSAGAITNNYGIYLDQQTFGTNKWPLYVVGGTSFFGGPITQGTSATASITCGSAGNGFVENEAVLTLAGGANQNIAPTAQVMIINGPGAVFSLGGFSGGTAGRVIEVINQTAAQMTVNYNDAGSAAANRIYNYTLANLVPAGASFFQMVRLRYSAIIGGWVVVAHS